MWRGRVHGAWFAGAVTIAVIGMISLGARSGTDQSDDAGAWAIALVTFAGVAYCLYRASHRSPRPPSEGQD